MPLRSGMVQWLVSKRGCRCSEITPRLSESRGLLPSPLRRLIRRPSLILSLSLPPVTFSFLAAHSVSLNFSPSISFPPPPPRPFISYSFLFFSLGLTERRALSLPFLFSTLRSVPTTARVPSRDVAHHLAGIKYSQEF